MNTNHPRFEDLSAYHDGEAPEWAEHVAGCPSCQRQLGELATLGHAIARAAPARPDDLDDPVTAAVTAAGHGAGTPFGHGAGTGEQRRRWVLTASAAAVIALSVGIGAVVASKGPHRQMTRDALPALGSVPQSNATTGAPGADTAFVGNDLGNIADRPALVARVAADLRTQEQARAGAASPAVVPGSPTPEPGAGGTRPCEIEARAGPEGRGELVYQATAENAGAPVVVLAFRSDQASGPITVEMRARSDCRLLLESAIP